MATTSRAIVLGFIAGILHGARLGSRARRRARPPQAVAEGGGCYLRRPHLLFRPPVTGTSVFAVVANVASLSVARAGPSVWANGAGAARRKTPFRSPSRAGSPGS